MHTVKSIYDKMISKENIKRAILHGTKGKTNRDDVKDVVTHIDEYVNNLHNMMKNHTTLITKCTSVDIVELRNKHKTRHISKPHFKYNQMIQYVLLTELQKYVDKIMYKHAYGSVKKRGTKQINDVIQRWISKDKKHTKYALVLDIHHCYPSVDQDILLDRLYKVFKDADYMIEMEKIIKSVPFGLALGYPISGYLLHFLFTPLDKWIIQQDCVSHYARYADNLFIFGSNKRKLQRLYDELCIKLKNEYHMEFNNDRQLFPIEYVGRDDKKHGRPLDVCGCLHYRDKMILRKNTMLKATRKAKQIYKKGNKSTYYDAEQLMSRLGNFRHKNMHIAFKRRVKPYVNIKEQRKKISQHSKLINKK